MRLSISGEVSAIDQLTMPVALDRMMPFLHAVAIQMISYFTAPAKGADVDQPQNLAKLATVE